MYYVIAKHETGSSRFAFISPSSCVKSARADVERLIGFFNDEAAKTGTEPVRLSSGLRSVDNVDTLFKLADIHREILFGAHLPICLYLGFGH